MNIKKYASFFSAGLVVAIFAIALPVFAQGNLENGQRPAVVGTVSAVSGKTLTVTSKSMMKPKNSTSTTPAPVIYTVDASSASVNKNNATSSVSAIAVGDTVMIQGTITGTNVVAKTIRDGLAKPAIQGNGQPIVAGKVTAVSGNTITITNNSNVTYTIDATNAKISNVAVGDNVIVQGTVNGNSVTASSVIDQKAKIHNNDNSKTRGGMMGNFFGGIGNFFKHMFGF